MNVDAPPRPAFAVGLSWGLLAAAIWANYTVLARYAVKTGLTPGDLTLLRFLPGGLLMAPFFFRWGWRDLGGIGWRRGLVLSVLAGPGFSLLFMSGFALAPLAHGAVIAPACQMLAGLALSAWLAHQRWTRESAIGAGFVTLGLAFIGGDGLLHSGFGPTLLGDALFVLAGTSWGLFGALSRRWQVDALRVTAAVVVLSLAMVLPVYLLVADLGRLVHAGAGTLALQLTAQGLGAGLVAVLAYSRAAVLLGSGRAGFFGALVPGAASLIAIPVLGEVPGPLQVLGIGAVVIGLLVAFGAARVLLTRARSTA
ncbi:MAG: DMT family transporter [Piscinibacter sp.]|nr:DMT family transporter [Piscinibacter sp.]